MKEKDKESKDRLLYVAMAEFAEKGYRGATLRSMGARAGVTAALYNYHFKSKERLAEAVVAELKSKLNIPSVADRSAIDSDAAWRAALRSFIESVVDVFTSTEEPYCYFAPLYRHESAAVAMKKTSLHDACLAPIFNELESLVSMGVASGDAREIRLWSLALWNLVLAYALKDSRRVAAYVPEGLSPEAFKAQTLDFMVNQTLSGLKFGR